MLWVSFSPFKIISSVTGVAVAGLLVHIANRPSLAAALTHDLPLLEEHDLRRKKSVRRFSLQTENALCTA